MIKGVSEIFKVQWIHSKNAGNVDVGFISLVDKTEGRKGSLHIW